jgi:iron complex outermembrane receptor protein
MNPTLRGALRAVRLFITATTVSAVAMPAMAALEEVVVTARKKVENLQETPVSVLAFSENQLESRNLNDLTDLGTKLPSVEIGRAGGISNNAAFFIRGLGTNRNAINQESAVALYIDDFYFGRSDGALLSVVDVENIEVLRGPQGTLFGRNASAGAIRYITKKPDLENSDYKVKINLGTDSRADLIFSGNSVVGENSAIRYTFATLNQDGYVENAIGQELGEIGSNVLRLAYAADLSDTSSLLLTADYVDTDSTGAALVDFGPRDNFGRVGQPNSGSLDRSNSSLSALNENTVLNLGAKLTWELNNGMDLKWVTTSSSNETGGNFDFDGTASPGFDVVGIDRESDSFSTEIQISGSGDKVEWLAGVFYYTEDSRDFRFQGNTIRNNFKHDLESIGIFAQATFDVSERFSITPGIRYTRDEKEIGTREFGLVQGGAFFNPGDYAPILYGGNADVLNEDDWSAVSGRLALEYKSSENVFWFASYARGFRAGGLNDRPLTGGRGGAPSNNFGVTSFDEETLDVFEFGVRSELFDNRLRANLTYFIQDLNDLQFSFVTDPVTGARAVGNAAEGEVDGIEAELIWDATYNLSFDLTLGTLNSELTAADPSVGGEIGQDLERSPELKYNLGMSYDMDLNSGGSLSLRVDYSYTDEILQAIPVRDRTILPDYSLLSANLAYTPASEKWKMSLYGTNITDEEYFTFAAGVVRGPRVIFRNATPARGSVFGVKYEYNF